MHLVDAETAQWVAAEQVLARLSPPAGDEFVIAIWWSFWTHGWAGRRGRAISWWL